MNRFYSAISLALVLLCFQFGAAADNVPLPQVRMQTSLGTLIIELYSDKSPRTVKNFLNYVNKKYYDGLIFHRVISGWLIQGGGYDDNLDYFATDPPIRNEAKNGLKNLRGTIAMARHWDPNSAESQFFINLSDNPSFNFKNRTIEGSGYCVFGKVVSGIEIADAIGEVETHAAAHLQKDVPIKTVFIKKVELIQ